MKRPKKGKPSKRIPMALTAWLKKQNPAMKNATHVRVQRLKGGAIKFNPAKPKGGLALAKYELKLAQKRAKTRTKVAGGRRAYR